MAAQENVSDLVLGQAGADICRVSNLREQMERAPNTHLLPQTTIGGCYGRLARPRVAAACVTPERA